MDHRFSSDHSSAQPRVRKKISVRCILLASTLAAALISAAGGAAEPAAEILYNGIRLPPTWPPRDQALSNEKLPPYLITGPRVVPIDIGRQLFVDDFLIEDTNLTRSFHSPEKWSRNPVLKPETSEEAVGGIDPLLGDLRLGSQACPFDDGVFFDSRDNLFKMWYAVGHHRATALAYSEDGLHWRRPTFDVAPGTNIVIPYDETAVRDGFSPWIDYWTTDSNERYKGFLYTRTRKTYEGGHLYTSPDGIHWLEKSALANIGSNDNTTLFFNPFRKRWALSLRSYMTGTRERAREYFESSDFMGLAAINRENKVFWVAADKADRPDPTWIVQDPIQLYTVAAAPYESLMLGIFTVHYGPKNKVCEEGKFPKLTQLKVAFSRDGFHWDRSNRDVFIAASKRDGDWDRGYLRAAGGCCLVVGDKLYFYYSGFSGYNNDSQPNIYAGGSTHVAMLRRDGFASMDAKDDAGRLMTRLLRFSGKDLFVNLNAPAGMLTAEALDESGKVIEPFSASNCVPVRGDGVKMTVKWRGADDLSALAGRTVRFRFQVSRGQFYAFWVSPSQLGESNGYVAAGGPGFAGAMDGPKR